MTDLKLELLGLVYRVSARNGGVITSADTDRVSRYVEKTLGLEIEEHEFQRIDGTHVVHLRLG